MTNKETIVHISHSTIASKFQWMSVPNMVIPFNGIKIILMDLSHALNYGRFHVDCHWQQNYQIH